MSVQSNYDPRYVSLEDVPLSGPDDYDSTRKRKALFHAESSMELDVGDGTPIEDDEVTNAHRSAVMNLATHVLTHAAEEPSDVTIGDMDSGGGTVTDYSSRYLEEYQRLAESLRDAGAGGHGNFSVASNTGADDDTNRYAEQFDRGAPPEFRTVDTEDDDGDFV